MIPALKDKGNALAKAKKWSEASIKYTKAIDSVDSSTDIDLQAILYTNRALCHLKLKDLTSAEADCTLALELPKVPDVRAAKALFRRAQARSDMEPPRLALALKDLKSVLSIDASNKQAQKLWQKLTEIVRQQPAPVVAALDGLRLGPLTETEKDSNTTTTTATITTATSDEANYQLLRWILGQTFDESEAKELVRKNVVERLWDRIIGTVVSKKNVELLHHKDVQYAIRTLANLCNHESIRVKVRSVIDDVDSWCWIFQNCPVEILTAVLYCMEVSVPVDQLGHISMLKTLIKRLDSAATNTEEVTPILRALVKWAITDQKIANEFTSMKGVKAVIKCANPEDAEVRGMVALCMGRVFSAYGDDEVVKARVKSDILPLLHPSKGALINANGAAALLCVFMVNVSVGVWAVQSSDSSSSSSSSSKENKNSGSDVILNQLGQLALRGSALSQTMVVSIFAHMVNDESGRAVVNQEQTMNVLHLLMSCDTPSVRAGAAVAISKAKAIETKFGFKADTDEGAYLLESVSKMLSERLPEKQRIEELQMRVQGIEALSYLMSSTIAKESIINGVTDRTNSRSRSISGNKASKNVTVLQSLIQLAKDDELTNETSANTDIKKSKSASNKNDKKHSCGYGLACIFRDLTMSKQAKARDKLREMDVTEEQWEQFKKLTKSGSDNPLENDTPAMVQRRVQKVVEAGGISALVALAESPNETSSMREALGQAMSNMAIVSTARGLMVQQGCLKPLVRLAGYGLDDKGNDIATMEKMEKEREAAKERELRRRKREEEEKTPNASDSVGVSSSVQEEGKKENKGRKKNKKNNGDSTPKEENVASVMQGENSVESRRTKQIQQETTTKTRHLAGQALARILISTNPEMLPLSRVMDSIKPLLALIRTSRDNLMEYEGLMALTNLLSMGNEFGPKERFMTLRGIAAVEYCQFSSHPQVRTAATECFVNVVYHEKFIKYMLHNNGERFKLWISFAESFSEVDENNRPVGYNNARAAMGGLAMMAEVPQLAIVMCEYGCVESMIYIMSNTDQDELHMRAAVCLRAMCSVDDNATKTFENDDEQEITVDGDELSKKGGRKQDGDPKLALRILAGYENTAHYDDMNNAAKKELLDDVEHDKNWFEEEKKTISNTKEELANKREELLKEQNSEDENDEEQSSTGDVEIKILSEGDEEGNKDTKMKETKEKTTPPPQLVKKEKRIEKIKEKIAELEKTLSDALKNRKEADKELKNSEKRLMEWNPEVWKGGIGVLNAFTKMKQIGEGTKSQIQETLKVLSDRL